MKFLSIEWKDFFLFIVLGSYPHLFCCLSLEFQTHFKTIVVSWIFLHVVKLWCFLNCSLKRNYNDWSLLLCYAIVNNVNLLAQIHRLREQLLILNLLLYCYYCCGNGKKTSNFLFKNVRRWDFSFFLKHNDNYECSLLFCYSLCVKGNSVFCFWLNGIQASGKFPSKSSVQSFLIIVKSLLMTL